MGRLNYYIDLENIELIKRGVRIRKVEVVGKNLEPRKKSRPAKRGRGRPKDPDAAKRRAIVAKYPGCANAQLCKEFDEDGVPLPWCKDALRAGETWTTAYKKKEFRNRIDKMISIDKKIVRGRSR
jgi:hypothetical protein